MTVYGISGLGADERVFRFLDLSCKIDPIKWIKPNTKEDIKSYALRLSEQIKADEFILIAVSFGGLIAVELNKILKPKFTILISSAETKRDLSLMYRLVGKTGLIKIIPAYFFKLPHEVAVWLFGARNKKLLGEIIKDTDLEFTKWAIDQLTKWQNQERFDSLVKIHGTSDKLIRYKNSNHTIPLKDGEHFMVVDNAGEISRMIEDELSNKLFQRDTE